MHEAKGKYLDKMSLRMVSCIFRNMHLKFEAKPSNFLLH